MNAEESQAEESQAVNIIGFNAIRYFVYEVERRAELNMLKTGKLEGAHYAAMMQLFGEIKAQAKARGVPDADAPVCKPCQGAGEIDGAHCPFCQGVGIRRR